MERRQHTRYPADYVGSFSGKTIGAHGSILDLSITGGRARSGVAFRKDEFLWVIIAVPGFAKALHVPRAVVRWSHGQEFGMEFLQMEPDAQQQLRELIRQTELARVPRTNQGDSGRAD
jgi:hypothetical protein